MSNNETPLTDLEALEMLHACVPTGAPQSLRAWLFQAHQRALQRARWEAAETRQMRFARGPERDQFIVGTGTTTKAWVNKSRGAEVLALAVLNPNRWVPLEQGRWIRPGVWRRTMHQQSRAALTASVKAALRSLAELQPELAKALDFGHVRDGQGLNLQTRNGVVEVLWRPVPGQTVRPDSPLT